MKFEYFLKSTRDYHFFKANLSSDKVNIQGQNEHGLKYTARNQIPGSITLRDFKRKDLKRPQKNAKFIAKTAKDLKNLERPQKNENTRIYVIFLQSFASFPETWYEVDFRLKTVFVRDFS